MGYKNKRTIALSLVMLFLFTVCFAGCGLSERKVRKIAKASQVSTSVSTETSTEPKSRATRTIDYDDLFQPADDEFDFLWASDYEYHDLVKLEQARDSSGLDRMFGYKTVTKEQLHDRIYANDMIEPKYQAFVDTFVNDYLEKYPGSDFRILYHNLETIQIKEVNSDEMLKKALDAASVACYKSSENTIYVQLDLDISKETDGYIILTHELLHACRHVDYTDENGVHKVSRFWDVFELGSYMEELIATHIAYELQGLDNKSGYYKMLSNYGTIIYAAIDYDGADFLNHSVNYFVKAMNDYMGTDEAAYVCTMMGSQAEIRFNNYSAVVYDDFTDLYDYMTRMYIKENVTEPVTEAEAEEIFNGLYGIITNGYTNVSTAYNIGEEDYRVPFYYHMNENGLIIAEETEASDTATEEDAAEENVSEENNTPDNNSELSGAQ